MWTKQPYRDPAKEVPSVRFQTTSDEPMNGWPYAHMWVCIQFWFTCKKCSVKRTTTKQNKTKINIVFGPDQSKWTSGLSWCEYTQIYSGLWDINLQFCNSLKNKPAIVRKIFIVRYKMIMKEVWIMRYKFAIVRKKVWIMRCKFTNVREKSELWDQFAIVRKKSELWDINSQLRKSLNYEK